MSGVIYQSELVSVQLLLIPLFFFLYYALQKRRDELVSTYIDVKGRVPRRDRRFFFAKVLFLLMAYFAAVIALMQPEVRKNPLPAAQEEINEVAFVLDVSQSMAVQDGTKDKASRIARAKEIMQQIVEEIGGVNVSLYAFQGDTELVVPPTLDYLYFQFALKNIETGSTSIAGTNFSELLQALKEKIIDAPVQKKVRIVCLTDGEDTSLFGLTGSALQAKEEHRNQLLEQFQAAGIAWSMIGVGTTTGGAVPGNEKVISHLVPETLNAFKQATNGSVYLSQDIALQDISYGIAGELQHPRIDDQEQFSSVLMYPLLLACFFLLLHLFMPDEVQYV